MINYNRQIYISNRSRNSISWTKKKEIWPLKKWKGCFSRLLSFSKNTWILVSLRKTHAKQWIKLSLNWSSQSAITLRTLLVKLKWSKLNYIKGEQDALSIHFSTQTTWCSWHRKSSTSRETKKTYVLERLYSFMSFPTKNTCIMD